MLESVIEILVEAASDEETDGDGESYVPWVVVDTLELGERESWKDNVPIKSGVDVVCTEEDGIRVPTAVLECEIDVDTVLVPSQSVIDTNAVGRADAVEVFEVLAERLCRGDGEVDEEKEQDPESESE